MAISVNGIGKDGIRANNFCAILSCIEQYAPVSRRDIARLVGLTPSAVTLLVGELMQCGLVCEGDEIDEAPRAGRRMVQVNINPDYGCILGIDVAFDRVTMALASWTGEQLLTRRETLGRHAPETLLSTLLDMAAEFLAEIPATKRLCAIGVSITGLVDPDSGVSLNSYGVFPPKTAIAAALTGRFQVPAFVDNNVRALALAELRLRRPETAANGLFIKHDPGFGCALLLNNEIFGGAHNSAGEIGHTAVLSGGKPCSCGKSGCLSTVVGRAALLEAASAALSPSATPVLWTRCGGQSQRIDMHALVESAAGGDLPIVRMLSEAVRLMAGVIENSLLLVDGEGIVTYGALFEDEWVFSLLRTELENSFRGFRKLSISRSLLGEDAGWKGAVCVATRRYFRTVSGEIAAGSQ